MQPAPQSHAAMAPVANVAAVDVDRLTDELFLSPLGRPDALPKAQALLTQPDLPLRSRRIAELHATLQHDWWKAGPDSWEREANALATGMMLLRSEKPGMFTTLVTGDLLAALIRFDGWSHVPKPVPPGVLNKVRRYEYDLPRLAEVLTPYLEPSAVMLREHPSLARQVARAACKLTWRRVVETAPLGDALFPEDQEELGVKTVAQGLLKAAARGAPDPIEWLHSIAVQEPDIEHDLPSLLNMP